MSIDLDLMKIYVRFISAHFDPRNNSTDYLSSLDDVTFLIANAPKKAKILGGIDAQCPLPTAEYLSESDARFV